jgi:hypothetical protein
MEQRSSKTSRFIVGMCCKAEQTRHLNSGQAGSHLQDYCQQDAWDSGRNENGNSLCIMPQEHRASAPRTLEK